MTAVVRLDATVPDVSVIIPVYKRAEYLPEAVKSVLNQTFEGSLEILIVDDGSPGDVFERLTIEHPAIHRLRIDHLGLGATRHYGFTRSKGSFIALLDDDDRWLPDKLALQMEALQSHQDLDLVFSDLITFTADGQSDHTFYQSYPQVWEARPRQLDPTIDLWRFERDSLIAPFLTGKPMYYQSILARRAFIEQIGGFDHTIYDCGDCHDLSLRATAKGVLGYINRPLFLLRRGHAHMTRDLSHYRQRESDQLLQLFEDYTPELRCKIRPPLARYFANVGWELYAHQEYAAAATNYNRAWRLGCRPPKMVFKWMVSRLRS